MKMYDYGFWGAVVTNALFFIFFTAAYIRVKEEFRANVFD
jgi:hypothetical protein